MSLKMSYIVGGAALSVRGVSGKAIKFVGVGEGIDDLEPFYPDRMASRILGLGDIQTLLEKAQVCLCMFPGFHITLLVSLEPC